MRAQFQGDRIRLFCGLKANGATIKIDPEVCWAV
jgi:hypothetical protein